MIDGGAGSAPDNGLHAWLVCDERSELRGELRRLARAHGLEPRVCAFEARGLRITPRRVPHAKHPTYGYSIHAGGSHVVWAPEFSRFPTWAAGAHLMFAEAACWQHPIRFRGNVGGHLPVLMVAAQARRSHVRRLVFAHIGRPTLGALAVGLRPPFGELAHDGQIFYVRAPRRRR
jgi:hypothetical protein